MDEDGMDDDGFTYDDHGGPGAAPHSSAAQHASNHINPLSGGAAYALYRHGQDAQVDSIFDRLVARQDASRQERALQAATQPTVPTPVGNDISVSVTVNGPSGGDTPIPYVNAFETVRAGLGDIWDDYIGQEPLKQTLAVHMAACRALGERLPHILLNSANPGVGKTKMARLLAKTMDVDIAEVVPPFNIFTLAEAGETLLDGDILFIDEIHLLGPQQQMLLKPLEDGVVHLPDGRVIHWNDITVIGATTEGNAMLDTIVDRFKVKPDFDDYSYVELALIAMEFAAGMNCLDMVDDDMAMVMARACQGTPRIIGELVLEQRNLSLSFGRTATAQELLKHKRVTADGLSRSHARYLMGMRSIFGRRKVREDGSEYTEYVAGLKSLRTLLRERDDKGLFKIERYLIQSGLVEYTPQGRRLTDAGIARAEQFISDHENENQENE